MISKIKLQAIKLRREGKSYNKIAKSLNTSKGTISYWLGKLDWSESIKKQLIEKTKEASSRRLIHLNNLKKIKFDKLYKKAEAEAIEDFEKLKSDPLFLAGISIYWGEGDKNFKNGQVRVSNIDSRLLKIFSIFLNKSCEIEKNKIKGYLLIYPDLDAINCLSYWSKNIEISLNNFCKPTTIQGRHKTKTLSYGVCTILTNNKYLKKKILIWIDLFSKFIQ